MKLTYKQVLQRGYVKPIRNRAYLNFVASLPCVVCGSEPCDAHHVIDSGFGGMGTKASDLFVFPLCRNHHTQLHSNPIVIWEKANDSQWMHVCMTIHRAITDGAIDL